MHIATRSDALAEHLIFFARYWIFWAPIFSAIAATRSLIICTLCRGQQKVTIFQNMVLIAKVEAYGLRQEHRLLNQIGKTKAKD